jgi:hypothetical protein
MNVIAVLEHFMKTIPFGLMTAAGRRVAFVFTGLLILSVGLAARVGIDQLGVRQDALALSFEQPQWRAAPLTKPSAVNPEMQPSITVPQPGPGRVD